MVPYAHWLSSGDNAWQLTAATLVGLMSIPALAVLYGGLVQKKWAVNTVLMVFATFCLVLITWVLWAFKMGFGTPWIGGGLHLLGRPGAVLGTGALEGQANIPLLSGGMPSFRFPESSLVYFQFVFAAITPILFIGSVLGRINFKVWLIFVPLWITFAYAVNAFLLWGGGYWAGKGALDFSGGYVIHLAAGVSGFVAAWVIGPRLKRDREHAVPNNLLFVAVGAGILWLGWNGFNGGDPYFAGADASAAVINTNLATAIAMMTWIVMDMIGGPGKKATFLGGLNGMICGLVGITPAAGYVNGLGAIVIGFVCSFIVWFAWNYLSKVPPFNKVDDALGVVYTHGIAGLSGGLLVGLLADPKMIVYLGLGKNPGFSGTGLFYGHAHQLLVQLGAAVTIIIWDGLVTFLLLKGIGLFMRLRAPDEDLEIGDVAFHGEEAYPSEELALAGVSAAQAAERATSNSSVPEKVSEKDG
ncbi:MAG TPA: ammonium transporter [Streptosporangiaceae bacterium]